MNKQRLQRVLDNMEAQGLDQILVTSTASVFYLTGYWIEPHERMLARSEERRVGKECRSRWSPYH